MWLGSTALDGIVPATRPRWTILSLVPLLSMRTRRLKKLRTQPKVRSQERSRDGTPDSSPRTQIYTLLHSQETSLPPSVETGHPRRENPSAHLNLKRDPRRMKSDLLDLLFPGVRSRKKAWCSTAHFHRCLHVLALSSRKTNVCSCSRP